ncbi:CamS family sex pheromone protein [Virgibacillus sp. W0430]|uniref:CamS family sex pheromone protein n=1 Tax=Virgibacillus sp. W0430 TaxID=3391580 RepID=UPI003F466498
MKKLFVGLICALLILSSCAPKGKEDEVLQKSEEETQQELSIVPSYRLAGDNYKMVLPYRTSEARGVITNQVFNRLDIDELEEGLQHHSKEVFDPSKYYFEEGQYLTREMVYEWLGRAPTEKQLEKAVQDKIARLEKANMTVNEDKIRKELQQGLNPAMEDLEGLDDKEKVKKHRENPRYLSHILEQNYLERQDDNTVKLVGVSIGLALKSVYRFQTEETGPYYEKISKKEMLEEGKKLAQTILKRVREIDTLKDVPIMIALYREEERSSPVPGNFVAKTVIDKGTTIDNWESIDEEYVLFPSKRGSDKYFDDYQLVKNFGDEIVDYFPNFIGVVGEGFYVDKELKKLTLEIPLEFYGKSEVIGFTQYVYGLIKERFPTYYDLEVKIKSTDRMESFLYRNAGEEDIEVHIFH